MPDVEATLGDQAAISKSTASAVCQAIKDEYQAWAWRRLDEVKLDYLFLDASFFRMHPGFPPAEPGAGRLGHHTDGKPAFIGLASNHLSNSSTHHNMATPASSPCHGAGQLADEVAGVGAQRHPAPGPRPPGQAGQRPPRQISRARARVVRCPKAVSTISVSGG